MEHRANKLNESLLWAISFRIAYSVEWPAGKPNNILHEISFSLRYLYNLLYISLSRILETGGRGEIGLNLDGVD